MNESQSRKRGKSASSGANTAGQCATAEARSVNFNVPTQAAFERLEARVLACEAAITQANVEKAVRSNEAKAKTLGLFFGMDLAQPGGDRTVFALRGSSRGIWAAPWPKHRWFDEASEINPAVWTTPLRSGTYGPFPLGPKSRVEPKANPYEKLELRIYTDGSAGLRISGDPAGASSIDGYFSSRTPDSIKHIANLLPRREPDGTWYDFKKKAEILRILGCKHLTLKRQYKGVPITRLTDTLRGLVNEHAPVMTIVSDPGFVE